MNGPNYTALVSAARNGNSSAIEALYNTTFQSVYYTAKKLTGNAHDAEELAQETYAKIFSNLDQIQNPEVFPAWANRIAANLCCSYLRKSRPVLFATDEQEALTLSSLPETDETFLPAEFVQMQDKREKLMEAIHELPEKQRAAIFMHYFNEMPVKNIAEELGVNENTVKSRLNAGRASIRAKLEKLGITSAAAVALTAALKVDSQAAAVPAAAKAAVWSSVSSAAAATTTATAAAATASAAAAGSAVSAATATAAAATVVKTGLFASLGAKIAAGVLAGVIAISGGAAVVANVIQNKPIEGVPDEMQTLAASLDLDDEWNQILLEALRYDFGEVQNVFEFEDSAIVQQYADGYSKIYLDADFAEEIPEDIHTYISLEGIHWFTNSMINSPYVWCRSGDTPTSACVYQEDGSIVIYQFANEYDDTTGEPTRLLIGNNETDEIYIELTRESEGIHIPIPEEMALLAEEIDENNYEEDILFQFLNHDFIRMDAEYTFSDGARIEHYSDGWCKLYIDEELLDRMDDVTFMEVTGETWYSPISHSNPYTYMRNREGFQMMSTCCVQNGQAVYYFRPQEEWQVTTDGAATAITFFDDDKNELFWICADGVSEEEADSQRGTPEDKANRQGTKLQDMLDFTKAWTATEKLEGVTETYMITFAFGPGNECICLMGWQYSDLFAAYQGTFAEENGRVTFTFPTENGTLEYSFLVTAQENGVVLVQDSAEGFFNYHEKGHTLKFSEDESNTPERCRELAGYLLSGADDGI